MIDQPRREQRSSRFLQTIEIRLAHLLKTLNTFNRFFCFKRDATNEKLDPLGPIPALTHFQQVIIVVATMAFEIGAWTDQRRGKQFFSTHQHKNEHPADSAIAV